MSAGIGIISQGLPHLFTRAISASFDFTTDCSCFFERKVNSSAVNGVSGAVSSAELCIPHQVSPRCAPCRDVPPRLSQPMELCSTTAHLSFPSHSCSAQPRAHDEFGHGGLPVSGYRKSAPKKSASNARVVSSSSEQSAAQLLPALPQPGSGASNTADVLARTETSFLHWDVTKRGN